MTEITVRGYVATIRNGVWAPTASSLLDAMLRVMVPPDLHRQYVPDRDLAYATYAAEQLGGTVTRSNPPTAKPGVVY